MPILKKKNSSIDLLKEGDSGQSSNKNFVYFLAFGLIVIAQIGLFAFLFVVNLNAKNNLAKITTEIGQETANWQALEPLASQIKTIKEKGSAYDTFVSKYSGLNTRLEKLTSLTPQGVSVISLNINNDGETVFRGSSVEPALTYQFYENLKADKQVSLLKLDTMQKTGLSYTFDLSFTLAKDGKSN